MEIKTDQERRSVFLRYINRAWLVFGIVTLASLSIFPGQRDEFIFLIAVIFPTYLIIRFLNLAGRTKLAGVVLTLSVNYGFYGLFILQVGSLGANKAFETEATIWMLMGVAVLFAGAFVHKSAALILAALNSILLIATRLSLAPDSDPRPAPLVFWWMLAVTIWLYEGTLHDALSRSWTEVMERKQIQDSLRKAEAKYRTLVEQIHPIVYTSSPHQHIGVTYISPQIKLLGFTEEEWISDPQLWLRQIHPDDRERVVREIEEISRDGKPHKLEYRLSTRAGAIRWFLDEVMDIQDENGDILFRQGFMLDITERKKAEEALRQQEEQFRNLFENAPIGIGVSDMQGNLLAFNDAMMKPGGYSREDILKIGNVAGLYYDAKQREEALALFREQGFIHGYEVKFKRKDGTPYDSMLSLTMATFSGQPCLQAMVEDITERKFAEEELKQSEDRYRILFNTMEEGVAINEAVLGENGEVVDYIILDVNPAFGRHSPYTMENALGKRATDLYRMSPEFISAWWKEHTQKTHAAQTEYFHEPSGRCFFVTTTIPEDERFATIFSDITARKKAEEEIHQRLRELQVLYETSNAISAEHDLNTLLQAIVENAKKLLNSASSGMYLFLPSGEELELAVDTTPYIPFGSRLRIGEGAAGRVAQTRRPLRVDDYSNWEGRSPLYEGTAMRAILEVPMLYKGELIGVLTADEIGESTRKFTEADEHLLSLFASQAAGAIHSARLHEETVNRLRELGLLYESGLTLGQLVNPKVIAQKIINLLDQKMDWYHTTIRLHHSDDETLELLAFNQPGLKDDAERNMAEQRLSTVVARSEQGLSGWVVQHKEVVRSRDVKNDPRYVETFPGIRSGLYVPMMIAEKVIGVICIESGEADAFSESDERLTVTLATQAAIAMENAQLLTDLQHSNTNLTSAYDATIEGWSRAMDLRDKETEGHTLRVTELTLKLAGFMGFNEEEMIQIRRGGLLHDIGKLGVPDNILLKNESLTDAEWEIMRKHPIYAYEMLSSIDYLAPALTIPYCHHEKWDGTGYPRGLKGEEIPLAARIFSVVDVWDAVRSDRPYRKGWDTEKAIEYIKSQSGEYFDPRVVDTFMKLIADPKWMDV